MSVESLKAKLDQLLGKHLETLTELKNIKMKNKELTDLLSQQEILVEELSDENKLLKLSEGVKGQGNTKETNLKINEIIREIDKCIAQLNR